MCIITVINSKFNVISYQNQIKLTAFISYKRQSGTNFHRFFTDRQKHYVSERLCRCVVGFSCLYPSLSGSVSCAISYRASTRRIASIHLLHHGLSLPCSSINKPRKGYNSRWCFFVHAALLTFQIIVSLHSRTINAPKRNFGGQQTLPLKVLEQGFNLTRYPNI
ncbi:hypothetical protein T4D_2217 [Trichinella pseudospiralis]|uniref:Uncharacterized protein n=1 Tax=Trichinella pseudospiralis TaxID=6337 RepID=A0A0V1G4K0_TRIPS|nr:hypothetical protein T4D_2217 [Trichinella pseudospiralis]